MMAVGDVRCSRLHASLRSTKHPQRVALLQLLLCLSSSSSIVPVDASSKKCTLCRDGVPVPFPDKIISVPPEVSDIDCASVDSIVQTFYEADSNDCAIVRDLGTLCGCPRTGDCDLCPDGTSVVHGRGDPSKELPIFDSVFTGVTPTCQLMEAYLHNFNRTDDFCSYAVSEASVKCGCPISLPQGGTPDRPDDLPSLDVQGLNSIGIFGDSTPEERIRQDRTARAAACLSIIGSILIIADVWRRRTVSKRVYVQIAVSMAFFDIITSIMYALLDVPIPTDDFFNNPGARGTYATCKIQGFFIQFGGLISLFLNASLATYYYYVVVWKYKEEMFDRLRKWLLGLPMLVGTILSFVSIPFFSTSVLGCYLTPPIESLGNVQGIGISSWWPILLLHFLPGYTVIAYSTVLVIRVYICVLQITRTPTNRKTGRFCTFAKGESETETPASHRSSNSGRSLGDRLKVEVFWQSVWYLCALYAVWFFGLTVTVRLEKNMRSVEYYKLWTAFHFMVPLQGFLNCLVYFRPRFAAVSRQFLTSLWKRASSWNDLSNVNRNNDDAWVRCMEPELELEILSSCPPPSSVSRVQKGCLNSIPEVPDEHSCEPSSSAK